MLIYVSVAIQPGLNFVIENERCICAKFASYLERAIAESEFREYAVDVEYNRGSRGNEYAAIPSAELFLQNSTHSPACFFR